ncbi:MAG: nucleoside triphosphate pyrophosphatase [Myxococcota bacterium]
MRPVLLASTSAVRLRMLTNAGLTVRAVPSHVTEAIPANPQNVTQVVEDLALAKARAVFEQNPGHIVIGADQLAFDPDAPHDPFGKPRDPDDHLARLKALRGKSHVLVTGFAILEAETTIIDHDITTMHVRADLSDEELAAYVATQEGSGCAAGYAAEGRGGFLFERIDGDFFNVLGLPVLKVITALRTLGWRATNG